MNYRDKDHGGDTMKFYKHLLLGVSGKEPKSKAKLCELLKYKGLYEEEESIRNWTPPRFPITGQDLLAARVKKGPILGIVLNELRQRWIKSDLTLTKEELLSQIPEIIESEAKKS